MQVAHEMVNHTGKLANKARHWRIVHDEIRAHGRHRAELDALEARLLREVDSSRLWRHVGCATILEYLERELGYTPRQGRERLRIARALRELPGLEACLASGELKHSAIRELTRVAMPETEQVWLEHARGRSLREIEALVKGRSPGDLPDDPAAPVDQLPARVVFEEISPEVRALLRQARVILADEHGQALDDDAFLAQLAGSVLQSPTTDLTRPSHQIAVTECKCGRAWQHGGGHTFELDRAGLERAKCDATHLGSLDSDQPARAKADITPAVRRFVLHRDQRRCTVPGCRSARFLDLHHIEPREQNGSHEPENLTTLCGAHHQQAHRGVLGISGRAPDGLVFKAISIPSMPGPPRPVHRFNDVALETQARDALVKLGFEPTEARDAIAQALPQAAPTRIEDLIRAALRHCPRPVT